MKFSLRNGFGLAVLLWCGSCQLAGAEDLAPPAPGRPWAPPQLGDYERELAQGTLQYQSQSNAIAANIDPDKAYSLPELIDLAERSHPETRIAWEQARQAAQAVGLSQSTYYPYLSAAAGTGMQHELATLGSVFPASAIQEQAALDVKWLLFDFGARRATVTAAREQSMMANVAFNAAHQQIVFAVTKSFYDFQTARQKVEVALSFLQAARTVGDATQARFEHGLATKPDVLQAEQQTAEAVFELEAAQGSQTDAQIALMRSLGILPTTPLRVADVPEKVFEDNPDESLDKLIDRALSQRPELVGRLANVRARAAQVRAARAAYYPKISLEGSAGWQKLDVNGYDTAYVGNSKPTYGVGLSIDLPLFDGFLRAERLKVAESQLREAEQELRDNRDRAVSEVWQAYTDLKTALRKQESANKLLAAAQSAFDASLEAYRHGLRTYVDTQNAQRNVTAARSAVVDTRSAIFTSAAALALSVGDLARPAPVASRNHQP